MQRFSCTGTNRDARKTNTEASGSSITNFIPGECHFRQRRVFPAKQQTDVDIAHLTEAEYTKTNSREFAGDMIVKYVKASARAMAPLSSI